MTNKPYDKTVLVLQGGGALGAYQVGVYRALCEAGYTLAHTLRRALHKVVSMLPEEEGYNITTEQFKQLGYDTTIHLVHFNYRPKSYEWDSKDYDFSALSIDEHLHEGYLDACYAVERASWLAEAPMDAGVIIHEVKRG